MTVAFKPVGGVGVGADTEEPGVENAPEVQEPELGRTALLISVPRAAIPRALKFDPTPIAGDPVCGEPLGFNCALLTVIEPLPPVCVVHCAN